MKDLYCSEESLHAKLSAKHLDGKVQDLLSQATRCKKHTQKHHHHHHSHYTTTFRPEAMVQLHLAKPNYQPMLGFLVVAKELTEKEFRGVCRFFVKLRLADRLVQRPAALACVRCFARLLSRGGMHSSSSDVVGGLVGVKFVLCVRAVGVEGVDL